MEGTVDTPETTNSLATAWKDNASFRVACMTATIYKTFFCFCREKIWDRSPLRPSFFHGPPMALILDSLNYQESQEKAPDYEEKPEDFVGESEGDEEGSEYEYEDDGSSSVQDEGEPQLTTEAPPTDVRTTTIVDVRQMPSTSTAGKKPERKDGDQVVHGPPDPPKARRGRSKQEPRRGDPDVGEFDGLEAFKG